MNTANNIRIMREIKGLTQENMADLLNLSVTGYAKIERGETKLSIERLEQIAKALEIPISYLLEDKIVYYQSNVVQNSNAENKMTINSNSLPTSIQEAYEREIASRDKEITYLKEIIALMKGNNEPLSN